MCGRYFFTDKSRIKEISSELSEVLSSLNPDTEETEIRPGDMAPILFRNRKSYGFTNMKWGFLSANGKPVINARSETVRERKMFSAAVENGRCAIPASGYYEWRKQDAQKFSFTGVGPLIYMAGLYRYTENGCEFVVLTREASSDVSEIHNRMPLILTDRNSVKSWFGGMPVNSFLKDEIALNIKAMGSEQLRMIF